MSRCTLTIVLAFTVSALTVVGGAAEDQQKRNALVAEKRKLTGVAETFKQQREQLERQREESAKEVGDIALKGLTGLIPGTAGLALKVGQIAQTYQDADTAQSRGDRGKAEALRRDATLDALWLAAEQVAEKNPITGLVAKGLGTTMDLTAYRIALEEYESISSSVRVRADQEGRARAKIAAIDEELSALDARSSRTPARNPTPTITPPPSPPFEPRTDWSVLDVVIEQWLADDLSALGPREPAAPEPNSDVDLDQQLRRSRDDLHAKQSSLDTAIDEQAAAQRDATATLGKFRLSVPQGWVPCQCPAQHPGAGLFVNGVQYHSPLLHCN